MKINPDYKSRFRILKGGKIALVVSALLGSITLLSASPSGGVVTTGTATISQTPNTTTITQTTQKASINWQSFSVAPTETVNFVQPSSSSVTLNRVTGVTSSLIEGTINANGQVFLLNPNGIIFSKGSSVNVGGLVASTLDISDEDFQAGNYTLSGNSTNAILNLGTINIKDNGYAVLAGKTVSNEGLIKATLGDIHLVGASKVSLNINGNSLIKLTIDKGILDALVENKGAIQANGGEIYLTSQALNTVLNGVVNNRGIIEADSIDSHNGKIILFAHGGTTAVDGILTAKDGFIETSGKVLGVKDSANIQTKTWLLDPVNLTIDSSGLTDTVSAIALQNSLSTADVELQADQDITVAENITWAEATKLTLTAGDEIFVNATINNTNSTTGGVYFNAANRNNKVAFDPTTGKVIVNNVFQLQWINQALAGKYELGSNIDASVTSSWNSNAGFVPIGTSLNGFTGSFDGLGHTISDLTIHRPTTDSIGLFGVANTGSVIQNIGLIGGSVSGQINVGSLVGHNLSGTIQNSYATGSVSGNNNIGGLIGSNFFGTITNSYATGSVSGSSGVGGLVGYNTGTTTNSYATGSVSGSSLVGGLVGLNDFGLITNSYWNTQTTGQATSSGGTGLTTAQMLQQANFTGFDFTNTWFMIEGETLPFLRSEYSTTITNDHQLQLMAMDLSANYTLANNITFNTGSSTSMWGDKGFVPIGDFTNRFNGSFDGLGHTISDLTINRPTTSYVGLFGDINAVSVIKNIGLVGGSVSGGNIVGSLVGYNTVGTIQNSYATGSVSGADHVGGLVGVNDNGTIQNSYATGSVSGADNVGGLVGWNSYGTIQNSYATGSVSGTSDVGGLVGWNYFGTIENSYATGSVSGTSDVGGLVGWNYFGTIQNSYATGSVSGVDYVGGLVGCDDAGTTTNSYSTGSVSGSSYLGGLVGFNDFGTITDSYWDTQTTGQATSSGGGTGLTTEEMLQEANFAGFDFTNDWVIYDGHTNPLLRAFMTELSVTANDATKTYDGNAYSGASGVTYSVTPDANLLGTLAYTGGTDVGTYTITPSGLYSNQQGYIVSYGSGTLVINPVPIITPTTSNTQVIDTSEIKQIKTPVKNGIAFRTDNIITPNNLLNATIFSQTKITNNGVKLPVGLMNNEEL